MKKRKRGGFSVIKGSVWPYDVVVCLGVSEKEFFDYMEAEFEKPFAEKDLEHLRFDNIRGKSVILSNNALVLWLKEFPNKPEWYGHLAHEIFHIADMILWKAGLSESEDSDEAWAYLIGWLTETIYSRFKIAQ